MRLPDFQSPCVAKVLGLAERSIVISLAILLGGCCCPGRVRYQDHFVGRVVDKQTQQPLSGVKVELEIYRFSAEKLSRGQIVTTAEFVTDQSGQFQIPEDEQLVWAFASPPEAYPEFCNRHRFSKVGYQTVELDLGCQELWPSYPDLIEMEPQSAKTSETKAKRKRS